MSKPSSGLFTGTKSSSSYSALGAGRSKIKPPKAQPQPIKPDEIRFSQTSVNGSEEIIASMKKNGWQGNPIDVVRMDDGELTTLDNPRGSYNMNKIK